MYLKSSLCLIVGCYVLFVTNLSFSVLDDIYDIYHKPDNIYNKNDANGIKRPLDKKHTFKLEQS